MPKTKIASPYCVLLSALLTAMLAVTTSLPTLATGSGPVGGDRAFAKAAKAEATRVSRTEGFSGVVLVARGGNILLRQADGLADRTHDIPNRIDTHFPLESITKQFTAAAILLLVEDGKISLSDPISKYYAPLPKAWTAITLRQLLNHSSGIVDCSHCVFNSYRDYIERSMSAPLAFQPGTGMLYSNAGYGLLAGAIEHVTSESYGAFIRARIFDPLHMTHSGYGTLPENSARGYIHDVSQTAWHEGSGAHMAACSTWRGLVWRT